MWKRIFKKGKNDTISTCSCSIPALLYIHPEIYQNLICKNAYIFSHTKEIDSQISPITQNWLFKFYYKKAISLKRFLGSSHFKAIEQNPSTALYQSLAFCWNGNCFSLRFTTFTNENTTWETRKNRSKLHKIKKKFSVLPHGQGEPWVCPKSLPFWV